MVIYHSSYRILGTSPVRRAGSTKMNIVWTQGTSRNLFRELIDAGPLCRGRPTNLNDERNPHSLSCSRAGCILATTGMLRPCPVGHTIEHVAGPSFAPCGAPPRPMYGLVPHGSDKSATDGSIVVRLFWIRSLDTKAKGNTSVENTSVRGMYRSYTPDMMIAYQ